jgi:hypothetical protein
MGIGDNFKQHFANPILTHLNIHIPFWGAMQAGPQVCNILTGRLHYSMLSGGSVALMVGSVKCSSTFVVGFWKRNS